MKYARILIFFVVCLGAFASSVHAQECPADKVCISREAALKALADADRVKALEAEIKVKDAAIESFRDELNKLRIEFARVSGEATALRTNDVRDAAIIELLLKYARKKSIGLIAF
jgi:Na+-transporting methylmalonyl-CoA/oxaloacetate decarboxylase gamma subunit